MKHSNISIFVPHVGCPHLCAFCDQRTISGEDKAPKADDVRRICTKALSEVGSPENTEIAFFGGSFTAIKRDYMILLLEAANEFVGDGKFRGIRISTRPDYIDDEILSLLRQYNVTAIELGAQSLNDEVLLANERGHLSEDVFYASELIKNFGIELGLQLMVGLYKSDIQKEYDNIEKVISIAPDTVRIYPVVILKGTKLGALYMSGEYKTMPVQTVIDICADMLDAFENAGIRVIKCGLHASEFVERDMVGGYYHPAFRELCEGIRFRHLFEKALDDSDIKRAEIKVSPKDLSKALGQKKCNIDYFKSKGIDIRITPCSDLDEKFRVIRN